MTTKGDCTRFVPRKKEVEDLHKKAEEAHRETHWDAGGKEDTVIRREEADDPRRKEEVEHSLRSRKQTIRFFELP